MGEHERPVVRAILHVKRKEQVTPHYVRVVLSGDDVHRFTDVMPGAHAKIFVPDIEIPAELVRRTYTVRHVDADELWIDFVVHDAPGPAAHWAARATIGTPLEVAVKAGRKVLVEAAASYVLVADASAIPVTAVVLESLPPTTRAVVVVVVDGPDEEQAFPSSAHVELAWVHGPAAGAGPAMIARLDAFELPELESLRAPRRRKDARARGARSSRGRVRMAPGGDSGGRVLEGRREVVGVRFERAPATRAFRTAPR